MKSPTPPQSSLELTERILTRLRARLPGVLTNTTCVGQKIVIQIPPGGHNVRIEWPPDVEEVKHDSG